MEYNKTGRNKIIDAKRVMVNLLQGIKNINAYIIKYPTGFDKFSSVLNEIIVNEMEERQNLKGCRITLGR